MSYLPHLVVLVHGYQGTPLDMRIYSDELQMCNATLDILTSEVNENLTEDSLLQQAARLATEVMTFIEEEEKTYHRVSFVGHSMGAVVARLAILEVGLPPILPPRP